MKDKITDYKALLAIRNKRAGIEEKKGRAGIEEKKGRPGMCHKWR